MHHQRIDSSQHECIMHRKRSRFYFSPMKWNLFTPITIRLPSQISILRYFCSSSIQHNFACTILHIHTVALLVYLFLTTAFIIVPWPTSSLKRLSSDVRGTYASIEIRLHQGTCARREPCLLQYL